MDRRYSRIVTIVGEYSTHCSIEAKCRGPKAPSGVVFAQIRCSGTYAVAVSRHRASSSHIRCQGAIRTVNVMSDPLLTDAPEMSQWSGSPPDRIRRSACGCLLAGEGRSSRGPFGDSRPLSVPGSRLETHCMAGSAGLGRGRASQARALRGGPRNELERSLRSVEIDLGG